MILDVEKVLAETAGLYEDEHQFDEIEADRDAATTIPFVDDSAIARKQVERTLKSWITTRSWPSTGRRPGTSWRRSPKRRKR